VKRFHRVPRYEKDGENGVEFVDVRLESATVRTERGVGARGTWKRTQYASERAAQARFRKTIEWAKRAGFVHAATRHAVIEDAELERRIAAALDDDEPRVVYGDWLHERGDPRGELIAVQRDRLSARGARAAALRKRERKLLARHSSLFYGALDELVHDRSRVWLDWRLGFFDEVELREVWPRVPYLSSMIAMLGQLQSARFVRRLVLRGSANRVPVVGELADLPDTLRSLAIVDAPSDGGLGDLAKLCDAHPSLEQLELEIRDHSIEGLALPALRRLELWTAGLRWRQVQALVANEWPELRVLGLALGPRAGVTPEQIAHAFSAETFPALVELRLAGVQDAHAEDIAALLGGSALARRLERVVLVDTDEATQRAFRAALGRPRFDVQSSARSIASRTAS
jgi:uncharacterized protein (TIGR02996 family)